jgi:uncharacterized protein YbjT (DUF2867 family)
MGLIVVSGATGRLGGRVARRLGGDLRLLVRDPARAPEVPGAEIAIAEYADRRSVRAALGGAETVLMVSAAETPDRVAQHRAFVDAAATAGVRHLVYTSFAGAAPGATFTLARDHWATEQHIRASGLEWTFLRDNLYADFLPFMVGDDGVIRGPGRRRPRRGGGPGRHRRRRDRGPPRPVPARRRDVRPDRPEALTLTEAADIVTRATGREVRYHPETLEEAYASRERYQAPRWQVDAWVSTYTAIAADELATVTGDVARLAGHPATSLMDLLTPRALSPMITGVRIEFTFTRGPEYFAVAEPDSRHDTWPLAPAAGFGIAAGGLLIVVLSGDIRALIAGGLLALAGLALLVVRRLVIRADKGVAPDS